MSFVENLQSGMMRQCSYATDVAENCPPPRTAGTLQSPLVQQPRLGSDWSALFFVWGIWVVALVATLWFTAHFSSNLPLWDDWWQVLQTDGGRAGHAQVAVVPDRGTPDPGAPGDMLELVQADRLELSSHGVP